MNIKMIKLLKSRKLLIIITQFVMIILQIFEVKAEIYPILQDKAVDIEIAKTGYTRFSFLDEKINDAFIYPEYLAETIIHKSGFMLILPSSAVKNQGTNIKLYLTLIGENGTTQDVILRFNSENPKPIQFIKFNLDSELNNNKGESYYE